MADRWEDDPDCHLPFKAGICLAAWRPGTGQREDAGGHGPYEAGLEEAGQGSVVVVVVPSSIESSALWRSVWEI